MTLSVRVEVVPAQVSTRPPLYRVLHDYEIWRRQPVLPAAHGQIEKAKENWTWRVGYPEVWWLYESHKVPFTEAWQRLSFALCDGIEPKKWRIVYDDHRAFMNNTGFWTSGSPYAYVPRRDYINGIDLNGEMPAWDKIRVCGGATISGKEVGDYLIVETLDYSNVPSLEWLRQRPWLYFRAVSVGRTATGQPRVDDFPQGDGRPVWIPLVAMYQVRFPLSCVERVSDIANPMEIAL